MESKATSVRVKSYTKELIIKHSKRQKITQDELIERAILLAEKNNFEFDLPVKKIEKYQISNTNRIIGFLKTQDKNLIQTENNIIDYLNKIFEPYRVIEEIKKGLFDTAKIKSPTPNLNEKLDTNEKVWKHNSDIVKDYIDLTYSRIFE